MAFQSVPDVAQVSIIFKQNGITMQNSFYAHHPGGYSLANLEALAAEIDARVDGNFKVRQPIECEYLRTEVRGLDTENDLVAENSDNAGFGLDNADPLPNNVTFAIKKQSGLTGRSARGRAYWIGIPNDKLTASNENILTTAYVDFIVAAIDAMRTGIEVVGTWEAVLVSRFANGVKRTEGVTFPWVSTTFIDRTVDTQRGRLHT